MTKKAKIINIHTASETSLNDDRKLLLDASTTDGDVYVVKGIMPEGSEVPSHVHTKEDEIFHVLEGTVVLTLGDQKKIGEKGDLIFLPRNIPHSIQTQGSKTAIVINYVIPGQNFEDFFNEMHAEGNNVSTAKRAEIASKYGITFL